MKHLVFGGRTYLPGYRWYRRQLRLRRQRVAYNRERRDAEEQEACPGEVLNRNGARPQPTTITPLRTFFQRGITTAALILFLGCGCLCGGAIIDLVLGKPGAVSAVSTFGVLTTLFLVGWRSARRLPGTRLRGDISGHVERASLRLHETVGRNVEVLSMTVVPEQVNGGSGEPVEVELVGRHIVGGVHRGDKVTLHGTWERRGPIRVTRLYDLTRHTWVVAKGRLTAIKWGEELLFVVAMILVAVVFFFAVSHFL